MGILALHAAWLSSHVVFCVPFILPAIERRKPSAPPRKQRDQFTGGKPAARLTRGHRRGFVEPVVVPPVRQVRYLHSASRKRLMARLAEAGNGARL